MKKPSKAAIEKMARELFNGTYPIVAARLKEVSMPWDEFVLHYPRSAACWRVAAEYVLKNFTRRTIATTEGK